MTTYICKCGRQVKKATNADNTGNRDTEGCKGCPYLLPWGPDKYIEGQGFTKDVQGYECRMSPTISYTTTYRGQANDKCTLHILSLDLDFLDEVQAWIYDNASDTLSAGFSRGSMRGTDFSNKGRYSLSISCTQNKKGMAAKAALLDRFFTNGRVRKDMTLVQEKAHILAAIKKGKENASKMNYIISEHSNGLLYAYYKGLFWFWHKDQNKWVPSDFARLKYEQAKAKDGKITPEEILDNGEFFALEEYQVPLKLRTALEALTPADSEIPAPDAEGADEAENTNEETADCLCSTCTCAGCHEGCFHNCTACGNPTTQCNSYQTEGEKSLPASSEPPEIVDECSEPDCMCKTCGRESCFAHGCAKECPANAEESCLTVTCPEYIEKAIENPTAAAVDVPPCAPTASDAQTSPCQNADAGAKTGAEESVENPITAAPAYRAGAGAAEQGLSAAGPASLEAPPSGSSAFDYSGLNAVTVDTLHLAENIIRSARQKYIVDLAGAVDMAHGELVRNSDGHNQHTEETFVAWCRSVGISKTTAYQLLQVQALLTGSTTEEQATLEAASPSLLYAAAKPSAPAELVKAVKDGDITTHKQYQDLLARFNAEKAAREKAEHEAALDRKEQEAANSAALRYKNECDRRAQDQQRLEGLVSTAQRERDEAKRRAAEAEKQRDGARDALAASKLRGDKLKAENEALKARPIEARVVDKEEIERRAQARADELTAPMREELEALRARHPADLEEAEQAIRDAYDSAIYTGRVMENAWHTLRPLLPRMDAHRRELAINQVSKTLSQIQGEIAACL